MKLSKSITQETRILNFHGDDARQKASIYFELVNDEGLKRTGYWKFVRCDFTTSQNPFTVQDFEFLAAINDEILKFLCHVIKS